MAALTIHLIIPTTTNMTQISRAALQTLINSTIYTNVTNDITGDDVNDVCTDINDSSVNWVTDVENTLTNSSTKVPTSAAVWADAPIKTFLTNANYTTAKNANQLRPYHWYFVVGAFTDSIWGYAWGALVIANSTNSILKTGYAFIIQSSPTYVGQLIPIQMADDSLNWANGIILGNANDEKMVLSAADVDSYNTAATQRFMGDTNVIVEATDVFGNVNAFKCKLDNAGTAIQDIGYSNDAVAGAYKIDFANDLALPVNSFNADVSLSAAELAAGNPKQILPAVSGHFWSVLDCQVKVNWNTTGFDTSANVQVLNEGATTYLYELKDLDTLGAGSAIFRAAINSTGSVTIGDQYIANTRLIAECSNPPTAGDGTVKFYVTAQLVEA